MWYLFLIGAASTAVEIAGLRFLAPVFGSSLPVWGAAIATVIAGLAVGYSYGGARARRGVSEIILFQHAAFGAALYLFMPGAFPLAQRISPLATLPIAFAMLFFPSVVFGAVSPLAVQVEAQRSGKAPGEVAGRVSTLTTLGSLAGILIPSFFTIPLLGTRETVWIFSGTVLLISLPWILKNSRLLAFVMLATASSFVPTPREDSVIFAQETPYQHVAVREQNNRRALTFDATLGIQSVYTPEEYTGGYWDELAALPKYFEKEHLNVLVLGAAASTSEHQMQKFWGGKKTFAFTSVEIDADIFDIADTYFHPPQRRKVAADARAFTARDTGQYDIIIVDTYARELTIPFHLATKEFFATLGPRLSPEGIVALNANASSPESLWIHSLARTLAEVFPNVHIQSVPDSCNYILLASERVLPEPFSPEKNGLLLTDNRAPTDWLGLAALLKKC